MWGRSVQAETQRPARNKAANLIFESLAIDLRLEQRAIEEGERAKDSSER